MALIGDIALLRLCPHYGSKRIPMYSYGAYFWLRLHPFIFRFLDGARTIFFLVRSKWTDFEQTRFVRLNFTLKSMVNGSNGFYIHCNPFICTAQKVSIDEQIQMDTDRCTLSVFLDWSVQQIRLKCFVFFKLCIRSFWTEQTNVCSVDTALLYTHTCQSGAKSLCNTLMPTGLNRWCVVFLGAELIRQLSPAGGNLPKGMFTRRNMCTCFVRA